MAGSTSGKLARNKGTPQLNKMYYPNKRGCIKSDAASFIFVETKSQAGLFTVLL